MNAEELVKLYNLEPHPEGGYYRETYRSPAKEPGGRNFCTAIHFLLPAGARSRLHRIKSDELWHFHLGGPLTVARITPAGLEIYAVLGPDPAAGHLQQLAVPAGDWFGAYPGQGSPFSFVSCTVSPGFEFSDLELADRETLLRQFPASGGLIEKLT